VPDTDDKGSSNDALSSLSASESQEQSSPEMQRLHDELVASKLREAEAHLSMKEFEQKLLQLQRHWQVARLFPVFIDLGCIFAF